MTKLNISKMTCQNCVKHVKNAIESFEGIKDVNVNLEDGTAEFNMKDSGVSLEDIVLKLKEAGYQASK